MNIGDYVKIDNGIDGIVISNRKKNYRNDTVYLVLYFSEYNFGYKWKPISKDISELYHIAMYVVKFISELCKYFLKYLCNMQHNRVDILIYILCLGTEHLHLNAATIFSLDNAHKKNNIV